MRGGFMLTSVVATRYAHALFNLAEQESLKEAHRIAEILLGLKEAIEVSEKLKLLFSNPILPKAEKRQVLEKFLEKLGAKSTEKNFLFLLVEKDRLPLIPAIVQHYSDLLDKKEGISRGILTSALQIDEAHQLRILKSLEEKTGRKLILNFVVNPDLLGGTLLQIEDKVFDASLATQLNKLSETIKRGGGK